MQYGGALGAGIGNSKAHSMGIKHFGIRRYKRMNIMAMCLAVFLPWITFVLTFAMFSFWMHYHLPMICTIVFWVGTIVLGGLWLRLTVRRFNSRGRNEAAVSEDEPHQQSWYFFIVTCCLIAFVAALWLGNRNFKNNTQSYYDIANLNTYVDVNPATVRGQELMDAGLTSFVSGTMLDLKHSMHFRNSETYCVTPITLSDLPLSSYDYWAVGINCCSETDSPEAQSTSSSAAGGVSRWKCPNYDSKTARAGLRVMRNEDRAFFRLAVQQAQSAYNIRATHPLFFYWVDDPAREAWSYMMEGFRELLIGMYASFAIQLCVVFGAAMLFVDIPPSFAA